MPRTYFKAPDYFVKLMNEKDQTKSEVAEVLGTSAHWLEQAKDRAALDLMDKMTAEQRGRIEQLVTKGSLAAGYAWARFRYEKSEIADDSLSYDSDKQIIKIKQNPMKKLVNILKGVLE